MLIGIEESHIFWGRWANISYGCIVFQSCLEVAKGDRSYVDCYVAGEILWNLVLMGMSE